MAVGTRVRNMVVVDLLVQKLEEGRLWGHTRWRRPVVEACCHHSSVPLAQLHKARQLQEMTLMATSYSHCVNCGSELYLLFYTPPRLNHASSSLSFPTCHGAKHMVNTQRTFAKHRKSLIKWKPFFRLEMSLHIRNSYWNPGLHWVRHTSTFCVKCPIHLQRRERVCEICLFSHFIIMNKLHSLRDLSFSSSFSVLGMNH